MNDEEMIKVITCAIKVLDTQEYFGATMGALGDVITELRSRQNNKPEMSKGGEFNDLKQDIQANKDRIKKLEDEMHVLKLKLNWSNNPVVDNVNHDIFHDYQTKHLRTTAARQAAKSIESRG